MAAKIRYVRSSIKQLVRLADPKIKLKRVPEYKFPGVTLYSRRGKA